MQLLTLVQCAPRPSAPCPHAIPRWVICVIVCCLALQAGRRMVKVGRTARQRMAANSYNATLAAAKASFSQLTSKQLKAFIVRRGGRVTGNEDTKALVQSACLSTSHVCACKYLVGATTPDDHYSNRQCRWPSVLSLYDFQSTGRAPSRFKFSLSASLPPFLLLQSSPPPSSPLPSL